MAESNPTPEYDCLLCMKPYNDPREIPCYHTFCLTCLTSFIDDEHRTADEDRHYFPCPVCDTPTSPRDVNTDVSTWGSLFPENNLFINQTEKTTDDQNCDSCGRFGESKPAVVWCTGCAEMLCKQCRHFHERNKMTAKHRLVPLKDGGFRGTTVNENCAHHQGQSLNVYCLDHNSVCCHICVSVSHRTCNHVKPIDDVVKENITEQPSCETVWESIKDEATAMLEDDESEMILINTKEKEVSAEATRRIQKAKDKLDGLHTTFQSEFARQCKVQRQKLSDRMEFVKKFQTNAENSNTLMTNFDQQCTDRQRFIMREKTKQQLSGHYRRMNQNTKTQQNSFDLKLNIGSVIDDIMKMTTIGNVDVIPKTSSTSQNSNTRIGCLLGTLMVSPSALTFADSTSASDLVGFPQHNTNRTSPQMGSQQHNLDETNPGLGSPHHSLGGISQRPVSIQHSTDQKDRRTAQIDVWSATVSCVLSVDDNTLTGKFKPRLSGGIFTDGGELLLTDMSNNKLVLFDKKYRYKREYNADGGPTDVAHGRTTNEILVSTLDKRIMRCTLRKDQLTVTETINCRDSVFGITLLGDNILICGKTNVEVMSPDGTVEKSISVTSLRNSDFFPSIAASTSTSTFYFIDKDDMVCRRLDSDVEVYRHSNRSLKCPTGIGLDHDNNAYVCGYNSGSVDIVSHHGLRRKTLVPRLDHIMNPLRVIFHPTKQEFVVTSHKHNTLFGVYRFSNKASATQIKSLRSHFHDSMD